MSDTVESVLLGWVWCLMTAIPVLCRFEAGGCKQTQSQPVMHSKFPGHAGLEGDTLSLETNKAIQSYKNHGNSNTFSFLQSLWNMERSVWPRGIAQWVVEHMLTCQRALQNRIKGNATDPELLNVWCFHFCRSIIETHIYSCLYTHTYKHICTHIYALQRIHICT